MFSNQNEQINKYQMRTLIPRNCLKSELANVEDSIVIGLLNARIRTLKNSEAIST